MNLNEFVVLPNSKAKSVKLNARNLQQLQMHTVTLAQEQRAMEENLQQLKETMSKQKEERSNAAGFKWKAGQRGSLRSNSHSSTKKSMEERIQKLLAGKEKIRVLKAETQKAPPPPQPPPAGAALLAARQTRLKGTQCEQCEVNSAGLMCVDCADNYCISCFVRLHQKGALKLHKMIPIQRALQTHVSTPDVVSCLQTQKTSGLSCGATSKPDHITFSEATGREDWSFENEREAVAEPVNVHVDLSQLLTVCQREEEKKVEATEEERERPRERRSTSGLLSGHFDEEESARSFQEALAQWRGGRRDGGGRNTGGDHTETSDPAASATATQTDLAAVGGAKGAGDGRVPVRVEFRESSLTYMDRLLLKKHRRTPIEMSPPPLEVCTELNSLPDAEEETESGLTAEEEEFFLYYASLFGVPASGGSAEPEITTPESFLTIEVLNEKVEDTAFDFVADQRTDGNRRVSTVQRVVSKHRTPGANSVSTQACGGSGEAAPPRSAQKLRPSKPKGRSQKSSSHKMKSSDVPSSESTRASKTSIKTSPSQKVNLNSAVHESTVDHGSPPSPPFSSLSPAQDQIVQPSHTPVSFPPDVSPSARSSIPEDLLNPPPSTSSSLRSTFADSTSVSAEFASQPGVSQSAPQQERSKSSRLPELPLRSQLLPGSHPSLELLQSPPSNLKSWRQSQQSLSEPAARLLATEPQLPPSPGSSSQNPPSASGETSPLLRALSSVCLFNESPPDEHCGSDPAEGAPSHVSGVTHNALAQEMMEEDELSSEDSGDEMSGDSLGAAPFEEDSLEEETVMDRRDEALWNDTTLTERQEDSETDEEEELSDTTMQVVHQPSAASPAERFCDRDGCLPPGGGINPHRCHTPEHTHRGWRHAGRSPSYPDPTDREGFWLRSSTRSFSEEQLGSTTLKDDHKQPTGVEVYKAAVTRSGHKSASEPRACDGLVAAARRSSRRPLVSESGPALRGRSREIRSVDQTSCEDPDMDGDAAKHSLHQLGQQLTFTSKGNQASALGALSSGDHRLRESHRLFRGRISDERREEEEEEATERRLHSVPLLP